MTTYADFIDTVARHAELPPPIVEAVLKSVRAQTGSILAAGGEVRIPDIGVFARVPTAARTVKNPRTGNPVDVPAGHRVRFRAAKALTERVGGA